MTAEATIPPERKLAIVQAKLLSRKQPRRLHTSWIAKSKCSAKSSWYSQPVVLYASAAAALNDWQHIQQGARQRLVVVAPMVFAGKKRLRATYNQPIP